MTSKEIAGLEAQRLSLQNVLDAKKDSAERNRMGQFATPGGLAIDILHYAELQLGTTSGVRFIDPAIGTGAFYSALLEVFRKSPIRAAVGYEVDPHYGLPATELWRGTELEIYLEDFTRIEAPSNTEKFDLLICNPPYVRHHHIASQEKHRLQLRTQQACGVKIDGLAGLYCYFLGMSHAWMSEGGLAGWLVPSEFMDVNYGVSLKHYLLGRVKLLHIHRFDPSELQFDDALVSSAVVWFRNEQPPSRHEVRLTYGGSLQEPRLDKLVSVDALFRASKWTRFPMKKAFEVRNGLVLGDFFTIKRGLVTGNNSYFILTLDDIERRGLPMDAFKPILPSPRYLPKDEVEADDQGNPVLDRRLFLLDCNWAMDEIKERFPSLWTYLHEGKSKGVADRYLCRHRTRWYSQEHRPPAPIVCTYLARNNKKNGRLFRFILNNSDATAANVYLLLYPKDRIANAIHDNPKLKRQIWRILNKIDPEKLLGEGRVYGGGLHKLEPKELSNVPAESIADLLPNDARPGREAQGKLFLATPIQPNAS